MKKPKRRRKRHFTAKDVGRIVAYARRDGADDAVLARYIIYAMGMGEVPCLVGKFMLLAASAIFLSAIAKLARAFVYIYRGIKVLNDVGQWTSTFFFELIATIEIELDIEFATVTKGQWLVWLGTLQAGMASLILLFDSFAENIVYLRFADKICSTKIERKPFKIIPKPFL